MQNPAELRDTSVPEYTLDGRCEGTGSTFTLNASSEAWSPPEEVRILPRTGRAN
jgi:hypothetical protein